MMTGDVNFDSLMADMQDLLQMQANEEYDEENQMCEYSMKYTSIDNSFVYLFSFDQRENLPLDILEQDAFDELVSDITIADIEMDKSETKDAKGNLQHPDCLKIQFTFEDGNALVVDGIPHEDEEDDGKLFTEYVLPMVIDYLRMGKMELLEIIELED